MLLAAGRGERMRPLTDSRPKPLLELRGKPLLAHHLEALARAGLNQCVINLSWLGEQIREYVGDGTGFGLAVEYSDEAEALETAGGIRNALDRLGDSFVVINADILTDYDFSRLVPGDSLAHLVLVANPPHNPSGDFSFADGRVGNETGPRYTFTGIARYRREFFAALAPGKRALAPLLREAAAQGQVSGEVYNGEWFDVGTPQRLQRLSQASGDILPEPADD